MNLSIQATNKDQEKFGIIKDKLFSGNASLGKKFQSLFEQIDLETEEIHQEQLLKLKTEHTIKEYSYENKINELQTSVTLLNNEIISLSNIILEKEQLLKLSNEKNEQILSDAKLLLNENSQTKLTISSLEETNKKLCTINADKDIKLKEFEDKYNNLYNKLTEFENQFNTHILEQKSKILDDLKAKKLEELEVNRVEKLNKLEQKFAKRKLDCENNWQSEQQFISVLKLDIINHIGTHHINNNALPVSQWDTNITQPSPLFPSPMPTFVSSKSPILQNANTNDTNQPIFNFDYCQEISEDFYPPNNHFQYSEYDILLEETVLFIKKDGRVAYIVNVLVGNLGNFCLSDKLRFSLFNGTCVVAIQDILRALNIPSWSYSWKQFITCNPEHAEEINIKIISETFPPAKRETRCIPKDVIVMFIQWKLLDMNLPLIQKILEKISQLEG